MPRKPVASNRARSLIITGPVPSSSSEYIRKLLRRWDVCHTIADKYLEYDPVIIIIDLVLLNENAMRHILYNTHFRIHWKLAVVLVLIEACLEWVHHKNVTPVDNTVKQPFDIFEGERNFYFMCAKTLASWASLYIFLYLITTLRWYMHPGARPNSYSVLLLWKGTVLSGCGRFLMVPSFIWGEIGTQVHYFFILGYTFISLLKTYSVVCETTKVAAAAVVFCALIIKYYTNFLMHHIPCYA